MDPPPFNDKNTEESRAMRLFSVSHQITGFLSLSVSAF